MGSANCHNAISRSLALPETFNLNALEKAALEKALKVTGGNIPAAGQLLGVGKTTAYRKVKQYGLATGVGATFCPNCGRRLPRQNPIIGKEVSRCLTATSCPLPSPVQ
jgi:hypothetical protein